MHSLIKRTTVFTTLSLSCAAAIAAGSLSGQVVKVEGDRVALQISEASPDWLSEGTTVQALGWKSEVVAVEGNQVTIVLPASRAAKVAVATPIVVHEVPQQERYGC